MEKIFILGFGGHALVVKEACEELSYSVEGFLAEKGLQASISIVNERLIEVTRETLISCEALGTTNIALGIGDNRARLWWCKKLIESGFTLPVIIHPRSYVSPSATLGDGSFVNIGAVIQAGCQAGRATIINSNATVEHHSQLGEGCHIGPGAVVAGLVKIGSCTTIGAGASVKDRVQIGDLVIVGVGAAVVKDVLERDIVIGVPAKPLKGHE